METITDYKGQTKKIACLGCAREKGEIKTGNIIKTEYFDAHQDYEVPIPGFVIISSRRHIQSVEEFTEAEQQDFIRLLCRVRKAMRSVLSIEIVYLVQAEAADQHFHLWIFPRYEWMKEKVGGKLESVRPIMSYARENFKTDADMKAVDDAIQKLKRFLQEE